MQAHNYGSESKNDEHMEKLVVIYSEDVKKYKSKQRWQEYWKNLNPEKKEEMRRKKREHYKRVTEERGYCMTEKQKERQSKLRREKRKLWTTEDRERDRECKRRYWSKLTPERKREIGQKMRKCKKQKQQSGEREHEYYINSCPENKEQVIKNRCGNFDQHCSKQQKQENGHKECEYYKYSCPEQKNLKYCDQNLNTRVKFKKKDEIEESNTDKKQRTFCYTCRMQFLNSSDLLKHITIHVSLPLVIVSKIDEHKKVLRAIKAEIEDAQINCNLYGVTVQNVICVKTEPIQYEENVEHGLIDDCVDENIEIDDKPFYTRVKTEIE